jgi:hypothetical protein
METAPINFLHYRKQNKIPADAMRSICKVLEVEIYREGAENLMPYWNEKFAMETESLLNHALIEYRSTGDIKSTRAGKFITFDGFVDENDKSITDEDKDTMISDLIKPTDISTISSREREPNKEPENMLVPTKAVRTLTKATSQLVVSGNNGLDYEALVSIATALHSIQPKQQQSILYNQKELLLAVNEKFLLTHEQVAELTGFSKNTISSKQSGFVRYGFVFTKVKEGNTTLWSITKATG